MKNFIQPGDTVDLPAPSGGCVSGNAYLICAIFAVAGVTAAENAMVAFTRIGVFELPKTSALAITAGDKLYWDNSAKVVNKTSSGNTLVGVAVDGAANPSPTVKALLTGQIV